MITHGEVTVPVNFEITDMSKQVLKGLIAETIGEALEKSNTVFPSEEALRAFVREEVHKALGELVNEIRMHTGISHNAERKDVPRGLREGSWS